MRSREHHSRQPKHNILFFLQIIKAVSSGMNLLFYNIFQILVKKKRKKWKICHQTLKYLSTYMDIFKLAEVYYLGSY